MMKSHAAAASLLAGLALVFVPAFFPAGVGAQSAEASERYVAALQREYPDLYEMLIKLERIHGVMFGALYEEGEAVRASGTDVPTGGFELDLVEQLTFMVGEEGTLDHVADEAAAGYAVLGKRAAEVVARTHAFHREVLGILVDDAVTDRRAALREAVARYQSRPEVALPALPKDMDVLYDHPYALDFRTGYTDLDGVIWAGHWLKLAATEPLTDLTGEQQAAGIDTVTTRYFSKLSYGEPPQFFPSELPLAPSIAPGIIFMSPEAAMIWDNLSMMQEVLADILASAEVTDLRAAIDEAVDHFLDPTYRMTDQGDWEIMALRHGIFFQGGYPLAVMTESERNVGGHAAHLGGGGVPIMSGM
jgi:hypothetical protein